MTKVIRYDIRVYFSLSQMLVTTIGSHFKVSKTIEVIMKIHIKMYLSPSVPKKHSQDQLIGLNIHFNIIYFYLIAINMQLSI